MMWPFKDKPRVFDRIGPDEPRVLLKLHIEAHASSTRAGHVEVRLWVAGGPFSIDVPRDAAARMPVGEIATFELVSGVGR